MARELQEHSLTLRRLECQLRPVHVGSSMDSVERRAAGPRQVQLAAFAMRISVMRSSGAAKV
jgi:hypothetical protein